MSHPRGSRTITLRDGTAVRLRPITPEDKPLLIDAFERLSEESRYRRFFTSLPELSPSALAYFTEVDHSDHEAIIALDRMSDRAVGVARYIRVSEDPHAAEVAVVVVDDWQGRGIGRALLTQLTNRARHEGISRYVALVQADNRDAMSLLQGFGDSTREREGSILELAIEIPRKRGIGAQLARLLRAAATGAISHSPVPSGSGSRQTPTEHGLRKRTGDRAKDVVDVGSAGGSPPAPARSRGIPRSTLL